MRSTMGRQAYSSESLRQAMGDVEALDPASFLGGQTSHCGATRPRQCHALRLAQWLSLALAAS